MSHDRINDKILGRLNIHRNIKGDLATESYVANERSVDVRRVLVRLQAGCLPLGMETGRYTSTPCCQRTCRLCDFGEVDDQHHFLMVCSTFEDLRLHLFNYCYSLLQTFLNFL